MVQAAESPELDERLQKQCSHLLSKMCETCEMLPTSLILQQELIRVGIVRCYGGFADVSEGVYMGRPVAIKRLRFGTKEASNKIFKVPQIVTYPLTYRCSPQIKRFCQEIIGWKRLSHPNVLPLLGAYVSTDPQCFRIVSDWMRNGNVMEYARSNPVVNRLQLVSPLAASSWTPSFRSLLNNLQLSEAVSGVTYLHEVGVVHGDLKGVGVVELINHNPVFALLTS